MTQMEIEDAEWRNPRNWRWGVFYYSRLDGRAFVSKRNGKGATLNLANRFAVGLLLIVLGGIAFVIAWA